MSLLNLFGPQLSTTLARYVANRNANRTPQQRQTYRNSPAYPVQRAVNQATTSILRATNPAIGAASSVLGAARQVANRNTSRSSSPTIPVTQSPYSDPSQMSSATGASPSTANTATGSYSSPYSPTTSGPYSGAAPTPSQPSNPYSDYLANEAALIQSGNKNQAVQNSQYLNGTTPTSSPSIPTPASAGAASNVLNPESLKSIAQANLERLQQQYLSTLTPSSNEQSLQKQLTDLQGATALGVSGLEGQGRLIPLNLIRGQQSQLQEQGNIQAQTLSGQIANEIANRQAQGQVYGAQLGFENERLQSEQQQAQQAQQLQLSMISAGYRPVDPSQVSDPNMVVQIGGQSYLAPSPESKLYEVGGNLVDQNGQVVYQGPTAGGDPYTLSPGQVRYDANGNVISSVPETPGTTGPATVQEYEYALSQGYQGSFLDYISAKNAASTTTSAEMLKLQANVQSGLDSLQVIQDQISSGGSRVGGLIGSLTNQQYTTAKSNLADIIGRLRSGGAITADEEKRFMGLIPGVVDSAENAQFKVDQLRSLLENTLQTSGTTGTGVQDDPLGLGFSQVGADTNQGSVAIQKVVQNYPVGSIGKQCGRFVNRLTGLRMGDSFKSKMAFTDPKIRIPRPGDFFVMPYSWTGHTGFVEKNVFKNGVFQGIIAFDSNWGLDEKVRRHFIPASKISGYGQAPLATTRVSLG